MAKLIGAISILFGILLLSGCSSDSNKLNELDKIDNECSDYLLTGKMDQTDSLALVLEDLAKRYKSDRHLRKAYFYQGCFKECSDSVELHKRESMLDLSQKMAEEARDTLLLAKICNIKGIWEVERRNYQTAQFYLKRGIGMARKTGDKKILNTLESNFSEVSRMLEDTLGMRYDREIFLNAMKERNYPLQRTAAFHCSRYYLKQGGDTVALAEYINVLNQNDTAYRHVPLIYARYWLANGDYEKAFNYILQSKYNEFHEAAITYAEILNKLGRYEDSNGYVEALFEMYENDPGDNQWVKLYQLSASNYHGLGMDNMAYKQQSLYSLYADSLNNLRLKDLTKRYAVEFGAEKLEMTVDAQKSRIQSLWTFIGALIFFVLFVVGSFSFYIYKRNKLYKSIVSQYMISSEREKELETQVKEMQSSEPSELPENKSGNIKGDKLEELWSQVKTRLEENHIWQDPQLSRDSFANLLGCSHTYLTEVVKRKTGMAYSTYINSFRIRAAKELLADAGNDATLKDIAAQTGFSSLSNFYTLFKQESGMPPAAFRKLAKSLGGGRL